MRWMAVPVAAVLTAACSGKTDAGQAERETAASTAQTDTMRPSDTDPNASRAGSDTSSKAANASGTQSNRPLDDASTLAQLAQKLQADHSANLRQGQALGHRPPQNSFLPAARNAELKSMIQAA